MNTRLPIFILGVALLNWSTLNAQQHNDSLANTQKQTALTEITIQENRLQIPFAQQNRNINIIDQTMIKQLPVQSVNQLLAYVAGIDVRQRGPWGVQADIGIDGGTFDQTLVLINGVKITDPQTGHHLMNLPIPLDAVERVEILRGAAARIFGVNAINGAINIITKKEQQNNVSAHIYTGSNFAKDTATEQLYGGFGMQVTGNLALQHSRHLFSISREQANGYRYNTAFQTHKAFYQNNYTLNNKSSIQLMAGFNHNNFGANAFYAAPGDAEATETVQTGFAALSATVNPTHFWTLKPRISYRYNHDDYIYIRQKPEVFRNRHETNITDIELNNVFTTDIGDFGLGLELRNEWINSTNLGKWDRNNVGIYGEYSFKKIDNLLINVGAYANYSNLFGWHLMPGIDAGYSFAKNWRVYANAGTGQRLPTYTDWYYRGPQNIGNSQLQPEYAYSGELGLKYMDSKWQMNLSAFQRTTNDLIDWVKDTITNPWQPQNFHTVRTQGLNAALKYHWMQPQNGTNNLNLSSGISYTYLLANIINNEGQQFISRYALENLRHQLTGFVLLAYKGFNANVAARYQERITGTAYALFDIKVAYHYKQWSIYTDVLNLGNVQYIEAGAVPMPGRWFSLGLKWNWMQ